jgi:hypothetical protein
VKKERMKMEKECCNIKCTETEKGYRVDIEGEKVKEKIKEATDQCCSGDMMKNAFKSCFGPNR